MIIFRKLVGETQNSKPREYSVTFKPNLTCIFLSVRVNSKGTFQCETPCRLTVKLKGKPCAISTALGKFDFKKNLAPLYTAVCTPKAQRLHLHCIRKQQ